MPYKPGQREYRSFAGNFHAVAETEDRRSAYTVEGYATTFDVPYGFRHAKECIRSTAMAGADMSDVIFQLNHCGQTLARLKNGTLELTVDEHGLFVRANLSGSQAGRDLYEAISNGLIDKMSWGFKVAPDGWEWDEETRTSYITKVEKVFDVSAVSIPADQDTDIHARSYLDGVIEQEHQELVRRENERRQRQAAALKLRLL